MGLFLVRSFRISFEFLCLRGVVRGLLLRDGGGLHCRTDQLIFRKEFSGPVGQRGVRRDPLGLQGDKDFGGRFGNLLRPEQVFQNRNVRQKGNADILFDICIICSSVRHGSAFRDKRGIGNHRCLAYWDLREVDYVKASVQKPFRLFSG